MQTPSGPSDGSQSVISDRFAIEREAGRGGMGVVYKALDLRTGQTVALKILRRNAHAGRERERFEREAQVLSTLRHPAIVSYVAHGQTPEGSHYLAMEWVDGYPLTERLRSGPLGVGEALTLLRLIASGLSEAHRLGIIHRDLKPSNILLRGGKLSGATILDFGIARGGILPVVTQTGVIVGTPEYMSPEQARGRRDLTPASDVFSLGCLMFECLTGHPPFVSEQLAGVLAKILFDQAPLLSSILPDVSQALEQLVAAMLAKEPGDRIADAGSLVLRLAALRPLQDAAGIASTDEVRRPESSITDAEQALVGVLVANQPMIIPEQETLEIDANEADAAQWKGVQAAMMQLGGRPEWLADGSLVVTVQGRPGGFATDLALQSARCALLLRDLQPNATVAMAMGRGQVAQQLPIGEAIDRALRLLRVANPGGPNGRGGLARPSEDAVRIDSVTAGLLLGRADLVQRSDGSALLLGLQREVDPTRPLLGKATPCIGREQDLLGLERTLHASVEESSACAITLTAPPGVGKSRLRHELLRRLRSSDLHMRCVSASCESQRFGASYGLLRQLLRTLFGLTENESLDERRARLLQHPLNPWPRREAESPLPFLGELCGISFPDEDHPVLRAARREPQQMSEQIVRAFVEFLSSLVAQQPLLIVLDDVQWCDTLSVKLLERALRALHDRPMVVLAFARPEVDERFPNLWAGHGQRIRLAGLSRRASERLVYHTLGAKTPPEAVARIVNLADGNALLLEELIRAAAAPSGTPQPDTIMAMLQSRIGRLPPFQRLLLRAASVLGQDFSRGGLRALLGAAADSVDLDSQLVELIDAEIVVRMATGATGESTYAFRHALLRDAAYTLLTDADRSLGHRLAARYLAGLAEREAPRNTLRDVRTEPLAIAEHYRQGGDPEVAVPYYVQAAEEAFSHHDLAETQRLTELARGCGASGQPLGMLLSLQSWVAYWNGQEHRILEIGSDAISLLVRGSAWWCKTTSLIASSAIGIGRRADGKVLVQILLDTSPTADVFDAYLEALGRVLCAFSARLEREWARRLLGRIRSLLPQAPRRDTIGVGIALLAESLYLHDLAPQPFREVTLLQEALAIFQAARERRLQLWAQQCLGEALCNAGARDQGLATLRQAVQRAQALGQPLLVTESRASLADLLVHSREPAYADEAETIAKELLDIGPLDATAGTGSGLRGSALLILAGVLLQRGEFGPAEEQAHQAYHLLEGRPLRQIAAQTLMVRALLAAQRYAEASVQADALQHVMDSWGGAGQPEVAARVAIAEAFEADGDVPGARKSLDVALALIQRASESFPGEAERQRFQQEVPENAMAAEFALIIELRQDARA
ncbi:MAG TPA: protein kinase [Pseudomonadota bacterium]|nr:protein kinase [Pseudomonadota bacterium]